MIGREGGALSDLADTLEEDKKDMGGVNPSVEASNATYARSIKGSDIMDISSKSPDGIDRVERSSGGTDTSRISYLPSSTKAMRSQGGASRSMIIYTIAFMRQRTPGVTDLAIWISLDQTYVLGGLLEGSEPMGEL